MSKFHKNRRPAGGKQMAAGNNHQTVIKGITFKDILPDESMQTLLLNLLGNGNESFFWSMSDINPLIPVYYSHSVINITGYTTNEIDDLPEKFYTIIPDDERGAVVNDYNEFLSNPHKTYHERKYSITRKDNETRWLYERILVFRDVNGKALKLCGVANDISGFKQKEEQLKKTNEEINRINSEKDRFISILSHDLRSPFSSILGFSEILLNEENISTAERKEYLNYIYSASQMQLNLVDYILDWSRLQTGRMKLEIERIHLKSLVYAAASSLSGNALRKKLNIEIDADDSVFIYGDERLILQSIINLVSNAIKFSQGGSEIRVKAFIYNEEFAEITVRDFGVGMTKDQQKKLFNIGDTFSTKGTMGEQGTGLGLTLVKEIVEKHKGSIWFYSDPGTGSEFHITIPLARDLILLAGEMGDEFQLIRNVIEDKFLLCKLEVAENAYSAISRFLLKKPTVTFIFHDLGVMDGIDFLNAVIKEKQKVFSPVIAILKEPNKILENAYLKLGAKAVLAAPLSESHLTEKLQSILS